MEDNKYAVSLSITSPDEGAQSPDVLRSPEGVWTSSDPEPKLVVSVQSDGNKDVSITKIPVSISSNNVQSISVKVATETGNIIAVKASVEVCHFRVLFIAQLVLFESGIWNNIRISLSPNCCVSEQREWRTGGHARESHSK